jgi:hypothetical protein
VGVEFFREIILCGFLCEDWAKALNKRMGMLSE